MIVSYCTKCGAELQSETCSNCGAATLPAIVKSGRIASDPWATLGYLSRSDRAGGSTEGSSDAVSAGPAPLRRQLIQGHERTMAKWETWFVMLAFAVPALVGAFAILAEHVSGVADVARFPTYLPHNLVWNMVLGILSYLTIAAIVPVALFLLTRSGQPPSVMGLGRPRFGRDLLPGLGIAAAAFGMEIVILIPFAPLLKSHPGLFNKVPIGHVPSYYVIWGLAISAITAVTEEVFVNGYLITRLYQFGWTPKASLIVSLTLRTSYHIYYGIGFLLTIPLGYFVTRSFQKHRRLNRAIAAHFIFDAVLVTVSILR